MHWVVLVFSQVLRKYSLLPPAAALGQSVFLQQHRTILRIYMFLEWWQTFDGNLHMLVWVQVCFLFVCLFDHLETFYGRRPEEFCLFTLSKPRLQAVIGVVYKYWVNSGKIIDAKGQC